MTAQCRVCKQIRLVDDFRLPSAAEIFLPITETYCPRCAEETLRQIQNGEFSLNSSRRPANRKISA